MKKNKTNTCKSLVGILATIVAVTTSFYTLEGSSASVVTSNNFNDTLSFTSVTKSVASSDAKILTSSIAYAALKFDDATLSEQVFEIAFKGFEKLKEKGKVMDEASILTICDFSRSSNEKRLWVLDMKNKKVLFSSLVAHGKNTGEEFAQRFSNIESSYQSSLGFYITEKTYHGDNGYSLRLIGVDKGYNDAALQRAIVMHGADYVSENFAKQHKRIGRSWGCPAVPRDLAEPIINTIKENQVLFIYYPDEQYLSSSEWLQS